MEKIDLWGIKKLTTLIIRIWIRKLYFD